MLRVTTIAAILAVSSVLPAAAGSCPAWIWTNPRPQGNNLTTIAVGGEVILAAGAGGTVLRSEDGGGSWELIDLGVDDPVADVTWTGRDFVALLATALLESNDGRRWTRTEVRPLLRAGGVPDSTPSALTATVAVGNNVIARGRDGVQLRRDASGRWAVEHFGQPPLTVVRLVAAPGKILAVGERFINTSVDGHVWNPGLYLGGSDRLAAAAGGGGAMVAVGERRDAANNRVLPLVASSSDGSAWTVRVADELGVEQGLGAVTWDGARFVAAGDSGVTAASAAGQHWTRGDDAGVDDLDAAAATPNGIVVLGGVDGTLLTGATSAWMQHRLGSTRRLYAITTRSGRWFAVGEDGAVLKSEDALTWTAASTGTDAVLLALVDAGGRLVAAGTRGSIVTSTDGDSWAPSSSPLAVQLRGAASNGVLTVLVGEGGAVLTSPDGALWTAAVSPVSATLNAVTRRGSGFVAVGDRGTVLASDDGQVWNDLESRLADYLYCVASGNGLLVVAGSSGTIAVSADGSSWRRSVVGSAQDAYTGLVWDGARFTATSATGRIVSTRDGVTWVEERSRTTGWLRAVAGSGGLRIAVGDGGTALSSGCEAQPRLLRRLARGP